MRVSPGANLGFKDKLWKNTALAFRDETLLDLIYNVRGIQVMLDLDLARLYQVETRALKQAVKRNIKRFPDDFMFVLDETEVEMLVSQSVIPPKGVFGGAMPFAFTEHGVAAISSVRSSGRILQCIVIPGKRRATRNPEKAWIICSAAGQQ